VSEGDAEFAGHLVQHPYAHQMMTGFVPTALS
jgi:hypothetical protein